jgi:hypothetical protein
LLRGSGSCRSAVRHVSTNSLLVQRCGSAANYYLPTILAIILEHNGFSGEFRADDTLTFDQRESTLPVVVVEVTHSQPVDKLLEAGRRWLMGSDGGIRTAILLELNYPGPLTEIRLWVFRVRVHHDEKTNSISRWGPKIIWKPAGVPLPDPDASLELGLEDIFGECVDTLHEHDPRRSRTISISCEDLRSLCAKALGHNPRWRAGQHTAQRLREGFDLVARNSWGVEQLEEMDLDLDLSTTFDSELSREESNSDYRGIPGATSKRRRTG